MNASLPGLRRAGASAAGRAAAVLSWGALALGILSCAGASPAAREASPPAASTSVPEVVVVPVATAEPEAPPPEATAPAAQKTVFYMNRPFKADPQLVLTRVAKLPDGLKLDFVFTNKGSMVFTIKVSPAGDPNAMFVELLDGRRLEFKSAQGISVKPESDRLEPGDRQRFSVTFDPLPEGVTKFHVYEGEGAKNGPPGQSQYWIFRNVKIE